MEKKEPILVDFVLGWWMCERRTSLGCSAGTRHCCVGALETDWSQPHVSSSPNSTESDTPLQKV